MSRLEIRDNLDALKRGIVALRWTIESLEKHADILAALVDPIPGPDAEEGDAA